MKNCLEIIRPYADDVAARGDDLQFFGGIGSHALTLPGVEISMDESLVSIDGDPSTVSPPQYRDDGNLRDFDALVKSTDKATVREREDQARAHIGKQDLVLSFFGLRTLQQLNRQARHPARSTATVFVSDRYVSEAGGQIEQAKKALFPYAVDLEPATLETWQLVVNGGRPFPIPHPGGSIINYLTRSISGLRHKDAPKLNQLTNNIANKAPEVLDWVVDGPGKTQMELARILHSLRESGSDEPQPLKVGEKITLVPYDLDELIHHEALMVDSDSAHAALVVKAARLKSRVVRFYEEHDQAVAFWQRHIEPRIGFILKNQT